MSDLIERDKAMDVLDDFEFNLANLVPSAYALARQQMMDIPSARPKGEWQMDEDDDIYHCSKCFFEIDASGCIDPTEYISIYNFCPNCGSDNRERNDDE